MSKVLVLLVFCISFTQSTFSQSGDLRQYSSPLAGYKVDFPSDWTATEEWVWPVAHLYLSSPGVWDRDVTMSAGIRICSQPKGFVSSSSNSNSKCKLRDDHLSDYAKNKIVSEETLEIDGLRFRKTVSQNKHRPEATFIDAFFETRERSIMINGSFSKRFDLEKYIPVFGQIMSSIQNLDDVQQIAFSSDKLGISLTYPTSWRSCALDFRGTKEDVLLLVPADKLCNGANSISLSLGLDSPVSLQESLIKQNFSITVPDWSNRNPVSGSKILDGYFYRHSYLSVDKGGPSNLLLVKEMYAIGQEKYRGEASGILRSIK